MPFLLTNPGVLSEDDYRFIVDLVYQRSRINLGSEKRELVTARLGKRLRALGLPSYTEYCRMLRTRAGEDELTQLIDVISTNHTFFFREIRHFEFLEQHVIPEHVASGGGRPLRVWSAASSTGEEPYSIALTLAEGFRPGSGGWTLDASDISTRVLAKARAGVFAADRLREIRPEWLRRWFTPVKDSDEDTYQVRSDLRQQVRFHHLNLFAPQYPFRESFHVVFCRNVMIYFDRATQETLVARLLQALAPGGYLLVGHSESLTGVKHGFKMLKPAIYQRPR